jgi:hypothetical protein
MKNSVGALRWLGPSLADSLDRFIDPFGLLRAAQPPRGAKRFERLRSTYVNETVEHFFPDGRVLVRECLCKKRHNVIRPRLPEGSQNYLSQIAVAFVFQRVHQNRSGGRAHLDQAVVRVFPSVASKRRKIVTSRVLVISRTDTVVAGRGTGRRAFSAAP